MIGITRLQHKAKIILSLSTHIEKQLGKQSKKKNCLLTFLSQTNKQTNYYFFMSKKSTGHCYLIAAENNNSSLIPE